MSEPYGAIDLGTTSTKIHTGEIFASGVRETVYSMANNVMTFNGKKYTMELFNEKVNYDINSDKSLNRNIQLNYYYALHKMTSDDVGVYKNILISLPASQWKNDSTVNRYKQLFHQDNSIFVDVNGDSKELYVDEVEVVPEDAMAYYSDEVNKERFKGRRVLLLGLGGFNLNQILFENDDVIDMDTDEIGCLKIFSEMASEINSKKNTNIKAEQMEDKFKNGLQIDGIDIDFIPLIQEIAYNYANEIYRICKLKWSVNTIPNVLLIGGGNVIMAEYIKKFIPQAELQMNPQTVAVRGMGNISRMCCA